MKETEIRHYVPKEINHHEKIKEMVDFENPQPQILLEIGSGELELVISVGIHGDELMPIRAVQELIPTLKKTHLLKEGKIRFIVCNVPALAKNTRFIDEDLNDIFPGTSDSSESKIARATLPLVENAQFVVDLHTGFKAPPFAVLPSLRLDQLELIERTDIDKIVVFEKEIDQITGPMVDYTRCGIGIEAGPHTSLSSLDFATNIIMKYLASFGYIEKVKHDQTKYDRAYFQIIGTVSFDEGKQLAKTYTFDEFESMPGNIFSFNTQYDELYPLLINPDRVYDGVYAYIARKITREELVVVITEGNEHANKN